MEKETEEVCSTCGGTGVVIENAGCCGGCEHCGNREEREVPCPDCGLRDEEDDHDQDR